MDSTVKNSSMKLRGPEEDELGEFFEKLATLVPPNCNMLNCYQTSPQILPCSPPMQVQHCNKCDNLETTEKTLQCTCSLQFPTHDHSSSTVSHSKGYQSTSSPSLCSNYILDASSYTNRSKNLLKSQRPKTRSVPYNIHSRRLREEVRHKCPRNHQDLHQVPMDPTGSSSPFEDVPSSNQGGGERLELLTDVIEYITTLQRILDTNPSNPVERSAESFESTKLESESLEPSVSYRGVDSSCPVDRVMELLEFKTGAITLRAWYFTSYFKRELNSAVYS